MTPAFSVSINGANRTSVIADRLLSLVIVDHDGGSADRLEIELDDRDGRIEVPDDAAEVTVALGFEGAALAPMGVFFVDGVSGSGPDQKIRLTATAADMKGAIRSAKTRPWFNKTLVEIVETIASEAGLTAVVGESVSSITWDYLAQTAESDLHFLDRITRPLDATAKPAGGALLVQRRGEGKNAAGEGLAPAQVSRSILTNWAWDFDDRKKVGAVAAKWSDTGSGSIETVEVGEGEPRKTLRTVYGSADAATRAAEAAKRAATRASGTFKGQLAGFNPDLFAGRALALTGMRSELNGEWHLKTVTHRLGNSGLQTEFEANASSEI
ncbi:phage late control D family protein [Celeribacter sp.]|uniref:phage late control D family protein n=1 Tax=Celeribacter sp. TaxID=1890673 RepID=UPI003A95DD6E